ncbi:hypothetical protein C6P40_005036 [Pichia californica]|uniref:Regulator of phospholipase D SRF1 n=1 Tax=Pichia californica TaxID=460514 RepID=A0A9P6WR80_9ASCO|nr:hypothetical protein C6P42_004023 [[Candida] californica]KAG0691117.1 hypothetical protein C6P40_005036 [[Candida] californica]
MDSEFTRVPRPMHLNISINEQGSLQHGKRSIKHLTQKNVYTNNNNTNNIHSNINYNINNNSNLQNVNNLDHMGHNMQGEATIVSPDDMMTQIEANVRISDINTNPNSTIYNTDDTNINKYYSLNANTIPPYVVARLAYKGDVNQNIELENNINKDSIDPFTATFLDSNNKNNVKWGEFLNSIKIPNSSVPVKTILAFDDNSYENGESYFGNENNDIIDKNGDHVSDDIDDIETTVQSYRPSLNSFDNDNNLNNSSNDEMITQIFKSYDFHSKWKGEGRLKSLFENNGNTRLDGENYGDADDDYDYDDDDDISDTKYEHDDNNGNNSKDNNIDLEKGNKNRLKRHRLKMHRHKRELYIKERAKYWLEENKKTWKPKLLESVMNNSYIPLFFRLISITLSTVALGLSSRIVRATEEFQMSQQPSPLMAMIVQAVGIIYLLYITYDEFTSQPLGLRNPTAKIRLVMLDLFFIIFSSANLSLSFQSIFDSKWVCTRDNIDESSIFDPMVCKKVKTLTAFLFLTLVAWCINFTISVFRIVHAVSYTRDKN